MKNHYTNDFDKKHYADNPYQNHQTNIMRIKIFVVINQINKHKVKYLITACMPKLLSKFFYLL